MQFTRTKVGLVSVAVVAAAALPLGSSLASGVSATPQAAAGTIHLFLTTTSAAVSAQDTVLITGAFSDHGTSVGDTNNNTAVLKLKNGLITLNVTKFNAAVNSVSFGSFNAASCSFTGTANAPIAFVKGTGVYAGIKGNISVTGIVGEQGALLPSGKCNLADNAPVVGFEFIVTGSGKVAF